MEGVYLIYWVSLMDVSFEWEIIKRNLVEFYGIF